MSTFSKSGFKSLNYNSFRPQYPPSFYELLLDYTGKKTLSNVIDIGCGTGVASFPLLNFSQNVTGLDLSPSMIETANKLKESRLNELGINDTSRIKFEVADVNNFEASPGEFDLVTAAECIHWFKDYERFFAAVAKQLKPGATLAYWYYVDPLIVDFQGPSTAKMSKSQILSEAMGLYENMVYKDGNLLGPYWEQPGRSILQGFLTEVDKHIPKDLYTDIKIRKYMPDEKKPYRDDDMRLVRKEISLADYTNYIATYSSFHNYEEATGNARKLIEAFLVRCEKNLGWHREQTKLTLEWYAGYTFMKRK
ncbi:hypothetical protein OXX69_005112 [Metschnikowia pulcherrima]